MYKLITRHEIIGIIFLCVIPHPNMNMQFLYIKEMHLILYKDYQGLNTQNYTLALYNSAMSYS